MSDHKGPPAKSSSSQIQAFLRKAAAMPAPTEGRGRLIFAMDATASREPTWDQAAEIQGRMFQETEALGGLSVQLCHYRGFREFEASDWLADSQALVRRMSAVRCAAGQTQIRRVLRHARDESRKARISALVFVGDCMEEDPAELTRLAGELGLLGVPVFVFHEGADPLAEPAFRRIARLSGGAYCSFSAASPGQLRDLLSAVAVYAAGGRKALDSFGKRAGASVRQLTDQMRKD